MSIIKHQLNGTAMPVTPVKFILQSYRHNLLVLSIGIALVSQVTKV